MLVTTPPPSVAVSASHVAPIAHPPVVAVGVEVRVGVGVRVAVAVAVRVAVAVAVGVAPELHGFAIVHVASAANIVAVL